MGLFLRVFFNLTQSTVKDCCLIFFKRNLSFYSACVHVVLTGTLLSRLFLLPSSQMCAALWVSSLQRSAVRSESRTRTQVWFITVMMWYCLSVLSHFVWWHDGIVCLCCDPLVVGSHFCSDNSCRNHRYKSGYQQLEGHTPFSCDHPYCKQSSHILLSSVKMAACTGW